MQFWLKTVFVASLAGLIRADCKADRDRASGANNAGPPIVGAFTPTCEPDGSYSSAQCNPSTGYCWCVDQKTGQKVPGSDQRFNKPVCVGVGATGSTTTRAPDTTTSQRGSTSSASAQKRTRCRDERDNLILSDAPPGTFIPVCDTKGRYMSKQCNSATNSCWCVNKLSGAKLPGSDTTQDDSSLQCRGKAPKDNSDQQRVPDGDDNASSTKKTCKQQRDDAVANPIPDQWVFDCDDDGNFESLQCYGFTHRCYCVDKISGDRIPGTDGTDDNKPDCSNIGSRSSGGDSDSSSSAQGVPAVGQNNKLNDIWSSDADINAQSGTPDLSSCVSMRAKALSGASRPGAMVPNCTATGEFERMQCHPSTGHCWCVDPKTGKRTSAAGAGLGSVGPQDCENASPLPTFATRVIPPSDCPYKRDDATKRVINIVNSHAAVSAPIFIPDCTADGHYRTVQCAQDHCWCVHSVSGQEYPGTAQLRSAPEKVDCTNAEATANATFNTTCAKQRFYTINSLPFPFVGAKIPQCDTDGKFAATQCHGSTGYCWCVNRETGETIPGTEVPPGAGGSRPDCGAQQAAAPIHK